MLEVDNAHVDLVVTLFYAQVSAVRVSLVGLLTYPRDGDCVRGGGHSLPEHIVEIANDDADARGAGASIGAGPVAGGLRVRRLKFSASIDAPVACLISSSESSSQALMADALPAPVSAAARVLGSDGELQDANATPVITTNPRIRSVEDRSNCFERC